MLYRALLVLVASFSTLACVPSTPVYSRYVSAKSKYITEIVSGNTPGAPLPSEVDKALAIFVQACAAKYTKVKCLAALKPVVLVWSGVVATSPATGVLTTVVVYNGVLYSGVTTGYTVRVAWRGKISRSAFFHELCHIVGAMVLGDFNANHTNKELGALESSSNTLLMSAGL